MRLLAVDVAVAPAVAREPSGLGPADCAPQQRAELAGLVRRGILIDLRCQLPCSGGFDGPDAIAMIEELKLCHRVLLLSETDPSYRHWIKEASRPTTVVGAAYKMPDDLGAIVAADFIAGLHLELRSRSCGDDLQCHRVELGARLGTASVGPKFPSG